MSVQFFRQGQAQNSFQAENVSRILVGLGKSLNSFQVGNVFDFIAGMELTTIQARPSGMELMMMQPRSVLFQGTRWWSWDRRFIMMNDDGVEIIVNTWWMMMELRSFSIHDDKWLIRYHCYVMMNDDWVEITAGPWLLMRYQRWWSRDHGRFLMKDDLAEIIVNSS